MENSIVTSDVVNEIEEKMLQYPQADISVIHSFAPGLYIRELHMPKDILAIGHHQKYQHLNIFVKGKILMLNEDGTTSELEAPKVFTGPPGRKIGRVLEDVVWLNVYATTETNVGVLEKTYLQKSEVWQKVVKDNTKDIEDYSQLLLELNMTEEEVRLQVENIDDICPLPYGSYKFGVFDSDIEGKGVFATSPIYNGELIGTARVGAKRTELGIYTNHSSTSNAKMIFTKKGNVFLVATKDIKGYTGGQLGEEITTNYRETLEDQSKCLQ